MEEQVHAGAAPAEAERERISREVREFVAEFPEVKPEELGEDVWTAVREGRNNYTSALDQFRLYGMLYRGEILNEELRAVAADFLSRVRSFDELQRYIPDAVTVWHKPGGLDHLTHDAGVFFLEGRPYFLGVFTWDGPSMDGQPEQARLIGRVSRLVYDFMKEKRA